jgi:glycosyltransferase involved in cell wall biosynthesis
MIDVSIIIPCYNRIELLKQTLFSVEAAISGIKAEIILVDDGSEIPVAEQIAEFNHLPLVHLRQLNSGLTTSRYNGLLKAQGKYLQFLDSDDQIAPSKLSRQFFEMERWKADVSHTDVVEMNQLEDGRIETVRTNHFEDLKDSPGFYVDVQPAPHSPLFNREYLLRNIDNAFIPLSRNYDSIGEIWFYYNLSVFPAKIIKLNEPLTYIVHHTGQRLTNHWERLGLCSLSLMRNFAKTCPQSAPFADEAAQKVAKAAFKTFRGLPFNIYQPFQNGFLDGFGLVL